MKNKVAAIAAMAMLALATGLAQAQNVVGYNRVVVPANSDARLSVPFNQAVERTCAVVAKTAGGVTVVDALTAAQYANAYYVRFTSGNASGLWATITANGVNDLTLANTHVLALVNAGDTFRVYRHQTLGDLFPKGMYGMSYTNATGVLIFDNNIDSMRQNKSAAKTASYSSALGRWAGAGITNATILPPETLFILRNNSAQQLALMTFGAVPDYTVSMLIAPGGDLDVGSGYPLSVVLKNAGLGGTNARGLLFYSVSTAGQNKSASKTASYSTGLGHWAGAGITGDELILPSQAVTFRLPSGETGTKVTINRPY